MASIVERPLVNPDSIPECKILKAKQVDHSGVYSVVKVLWKETALPRCRATDSRWNR